MGDFGYADHFSKLNRLTDEEYRRAVASYRLKVGKFLPGRDAVIFDFGCGAGHFLWFLKQERYHRSFGADPDPTMVELCKARGLDNVLLAWPEHLLRHQAYDCIVLNDVLEHLRKDDILKLLNKIRDSLRPGGRVVVKTQNMANPFSMRIRYIDFQHSIGFEEHSLPEILSMSGFVNVQVLEALPPERLKKWLWPLPRLVWRVAYLAAGQRAPKILTPMIIGVGERSP